MESPIGSPALAIFFRLMLLGVMSTLIAVEALLLLLLFYYFNMVKLKADAKQ